MKLRDLRRISASAATRSVLHTAPETTFATTAKPSRVNSAAAAVRVGMKKAFNQQTRTRDFPAGCSGSGGSALSTADRESRATDHPAQRRRSLLTAAIMPKPATTPQLTVRPSGFARSVVQGWMKAHAEERAASGQASDTETEEVEEMEARPDRLGLGAKFLSHNRAILTSTTNVVGARLGKKLRRYQAGEVSRLGFGLGLASLFRGIATARAVYHSSYATPLSFPTTEADRWG